LNSARRVSSDSGGCDVRRAPPKSHGLRVLTSSLSRFLLCEGLTYKESADGFGARTRERSSGGDVWITKRQPSLCLEPHCPGPRP